jgi:hypothetical protein
LKQADFNKALEELGFKLRKTKSFNAWEGLRLRPRGGSSEGFEP